MKCWTVQRVTCQVSRFNSIWIFLNNSNEVLVLGNLYRAQMFK
jgi:hypothetical protein